MKNMIISSICCTLFLPLGAWSNPDLKCKTDADCGLIPISGCLGCLNGEGHRAINKTAAKEIMEAKQDKCMADFKAFKGPQEDKQAHESCKLNAANCKQGVCVGVQLSEEELKKRMPKAPK